MAAIRNSSNPCDAEPMGLELSNVRVLFYAREKFGSNYMNHIATGILIDKDGKLLAYLRDDKPSIPFPNHWDLFGGYVEDGETNEEALVREVQEELGCNLKDYSFYKDYECLKGDDHVNVKHVFVAHIDAKADDLTLYEGQELRGIPLEEIHEYKWANILGVILDDFVKDQAN